MNRIIAAISRFKWFRLLCLPAALLQSPIAKAELPQFNLACSPTNDLYITMRACGLKRRRFDSPEKTVDAAGRGSAVLLLADGPPPKTVVLSDALFQKAARKELRLYVEFPSYVPGIQFGAPQKTSWERFVVNKTIGADLPRGRIMMAHDCYYLPTHADDPVLVVARVAGYNDAVYGIPALAQPILFPINDGRIWVATTKLSGFLTGRYAPKREWKALWGFILSRLSGSDSVQLDWQPRVTTMFGPTENMPANHEARAVRNAAGWCFNSSLLVSPADLPMLNADWKSSIELDDFAPLKAHGGDGSLGILEGFNSQIHGDGSQQVRTPIRADCQAESAMVLATDWALNRTRVSRQTAVNLLDFLYFSSGMCGGDRGNPKHPAYGLISWGAITPAWTVANYGDDNARTMLATMLAASELPSDRWNEPLLRALMAHLRTTGTLGFRGDRIDMPQLEQYGWKHFHDSSAINYSPHFESYLWACYLWAYAHTGEKEFFEKSKTAIRMTMQAFPDKWRWNDNIERARMLLCLAWLVRVEDTEEHRHWLRLMAQDLISVQESNGALPEQFRSKAATGYQIPLSNEAYGTSETPLIQENGDPVTDQLYVSGFALLGLHEASAVLQDTRIQSAEDRLADYLCRIQVRSKTLPQLQGTWFRAFDFDRWEAWASSGDAGWGAWSEETGWGQSWTAAALGLRQRRTSLWQETVAMDLRACLPKVRGQMAENQGAPWK